MTIINLTGPVFKTLYLAAALGFACCLGAAAAPAPAPAKDAGGSRGLSPAQWKALANKKIFFGHMSVGNGLIAGVREISRDRGKKRLRVVEVSPDTSFRPATLAHSALGRNADAMAKIDSFRDLINSGIGKEVDIALFKLCYVDIKAGTDIEKIFAHYRQTMNGLERQYPNVIFAHMTVPLRTVQTGWKAGVKKAFFLPVGGYDDNIARNRYNGMLRLEYGPGGRLFDLADIESTCRNGTRAKFTNRSGTYYCLAADNTDDGGHLNASGRKLAAEQFLKFLAGL